MRACFEKRLKIVPETPLDRVRDSLLSTGFFFTFRASKWCPEGSLGRLGALLDGFWRALGRSWGALGTILSALGRSWALLGRSWDALGTLLGALNSLLGRSGPLLGPLGRSGIEFEASEGRFWCLQMSILVLVLSNQW